MSDLQNFKCRFCDGRVVFDSASQKMKCTACDSEFELSEFQGQEETQAAAQETEGDSFEGDFSMGAGSWGTGETDGMNVYQCEHCGGEIIADGNLGSSKCPYCDNNIVMKGQFAGDLKPELIIPFKLDKNAAKKKYLEHLNGKKFLPKVFKDQNHIDEIKGVYVPFWLYDASVDAGINFEATKVKRWSDDKFNYEETSFFSVQRDGSLSFDKIPADGSSKMPDDLMESIEPFDLKGAVPFTTAYLAGYLADKYDVDAEKNMDHIRERITTSTISHFEETVKGYDSVSIRHKNIRIKKGETHYAMYPVWLLNTTWNGEKFTFAMNGQTGKFVGNLPLDKGAYWKTFAGLAALFSAIAVAINFFMG